MRAADNSDDYAMYMQKASELRATSEGQNMRVSAAQQINVHEAEMKSANEEYKVAEVKTIE